MSRLFLSFILRLLVVAFSFHLFFLPYCNFTSLPFFSLTPIFFVIFFPSKPCFPLPALLYLLYLFPSLPLLFSSLLFDFFSSYFFHVLSNCSGYCICFYCLPFIIPSLPTALLPLNQLFPGSEGRKAVVLVTGLVSEGKRKPILVIKTEIFQIWYYRK